MKRILVLILILLNIITMRVFAEGYVNPSDVEMGPNGTWVGHMTLPVNDELTSGYFRTYDGSFHGAYDFGSEIGTPVQAAASGHVEAVGYVDSTGTYIYIRHKESNHNLVNMDSNPDYQEDHDGYIYTSYFHLSDYIVAVDEEIHQGQIIGYSGNSGVDSYGRPYPAHLHFGVQTSIAGSHHAYDPAFFLNGEFLPATGGELARAKVTKFMFDAAFNFTEPINDMLDTITEACTSGFSLLRGLIKRILIILITIDLALAACLNVLDRNGMPFFEWLLNKLLIYCIFIFILEYWGDTIINLSRDIFIGAGAVMAGSTPDEAMALIRDPFDLIKKGANIVGAIFTQMSNMRSIFDIAGTILTAVPIFIFIVIIFGSLTLITYHIVLAYLEFYFMALFGFTAFMFAGFKHTRQFAERGFNGIFACSIQLMFFCIFSLMLQNFMKNIVAEDFFKTESISAAKAKDGDFGGAEGLEVVLAAIREQESGGHYNIYEGQNAGEPPHSSNQGYGAYQFTGKSRWKDGCDEYVSSGSPYGPLLPIGMGDFDNDPNQYPGMWTQSDYSWDPSNQDKVAKWEMYCYYQKYGNWKAVIEAWNGGENSIGESYVQGYYRSVCAKAGRTASKVAINLAVFFKLALICLVFLILGDRIGKHVMRTVGSKNGFKFLDEE